MEGAGPSFASLLNTLLNSRRGLLPLHFLQVPQRRGGSAHRGNRGGSLDCTVSLSKGWIMPVPGLPQATQLLLLVQPVCDRNSKGSAPSTDVLKARHTVPRAGPGPI